MIYLHRWRNTFFLSLILGIPTIFVAFINSFHYEVIHWPVVYGGVTVEEVILFILATIIQVSGIFTLYLPVLDFATCVILLSFSLHRYLEGINFMFQHTSLFAIVLLIWMC